jgi:hypothetical protein
MMPRTRLCVIFFIGIVATTHGQRLHDARIKDSVIGWWSNNHFDNLIKPSTDPVYQKRVKVATDMVGWIKRSYTPVGGLGTYRRQNFKHIFGVYLMVWNVSFDPMWLDEKKQFKPIAEENTPFALQANAIPGSYGIGYLNETSASYYFTWPPDGYGAMAGQRREEALKTNPNTAPFITRSNETQAVYLAPGNQLPFIAVTRGEYLDRAEAAFDKQLQKRKERINQQWPGNTAQDQKSRETAFEKVREEYGRYLQNIRSMREKYGSSLSEPAVIRNMQPTLIGDFSLMDLFEINPQEKASKRYYPVFKVTPETMDKCRSPQPQWVVAWFPNETREDGNQLYEMYRSMMEHLNYGYIHNYFFAPEKNGGKPYSPAQESALQSRLDAYRTKIKG